MNDRRLKWCRGGRREAILDVARQVFLQDGYAAASMSDIAARLGGSKGTLYNYFRSKEELFEAHIRDQCAAYGHATFGAPLEGDNVGEVIATLGERILTFTLSDEIVAFYSLVMAEAVRNPKIGRTFYESGPRMGVSRVAEFLETARDRGKIAAEDCVEAAEQFLSLIHGTLHMKRLLNVIERPSPPEIRAEADRVARTFMRAYGAGG